MLFLFRKVSTLIGIIIIIAAAATIFSGVFVYQYFAVKVNNQLQTQIQNEQQNKNGFIEGPFSFPSDVIPFGMKVCVENIQTQKKYCVECEKKVYECPLKDVNSEFQMPCQVKNEPTYTLCGVDNFKIEVPAGKYYVYSQVPNWDEKAYYSEFLTCGADVDCYSHKPIIIDVNSGDVIKDVYPSDWYVEGLTWKTYRNDRMGFEIKYPPDLTVSEEKVMSTGTEVDFLKKNDIVFSIRIGIYYSQELQRAYTLDELVSSLFKSFKEGESKKNIKFGVGNYNGIRINKYNYNEAGVIKLIPYLFADVPNDEQGNILEITGNIPSLDHDVYKLFDQMFPTFKFIDVE